MMIIILSILGFVYVITACIVHEYLKVFENGYYTDDDKFGMSVLWPIFIPKIIIGKIFLRIKNCIEKTK